MRFHELPVGQRFEFEGEAYVKISPLVAKAEGNWKTRFMPRATEVQPVQAEAPRPAVVQRREVETEAVVRAFDAFYGECLRCVDDLGAGGGEALKAAQAVLGEARQRFLDALNAGA